MSRPTGREQVARMMQMPVHTHAARAADFIQKAQESSKAAFAAEEKAMDHAEAADQLTGKAHTQQLKLQKAQLKHAAVLRRNEEMFQTTAPKPLRGGGKNCGEKRAHLYGGSEARKRAPPRESYGHAHA